jgi:hypothetical protein
MHSDAHAVYSIYLAILLAPASEGDPLMVLCNASQCMHAWIGCVSLPKL